MKGKRLFLCSVSGTVFAVTASLALPAGRVARELSVARRRVTGEANAVQKRHELNDRFPSGHATASPCHGCLGEAETGEANAVQKRDELSDRFSGGGTARRGRDLLSGNANRTSRLP